jgi:hypothetical protein
MECEEMVIQQTYTNTHTHTHTHTHTRTQEEANQDEGDGSELASGESAQSDDVETAAGDIVAGNSGGCPLSQFAFFLYAFFFRLF